MRTIKRPNAKNIKVEWRESPEYYRMPTGELRRIVPKRMSRKVKQRANTGRG